VLIAAHGNSLRALVKYLDNMTDADIMALNIPTGICTTPWAIKKRAPFMFSITLANIDGFL